MKSEFSSIELAVAEVKRLRRVITACDCQCHTTGTCHDLIADRRRYLTLALMHLKTMMLNQDRWPSQQHAAQLIEDMLAGRWRE